MSAGTKWKTVMGAIDPVPPAGRRPSGTRDDRNTKPISRGSTTHASTSSRQPAMAPSRSHEVRGGVRAQYAVPRDEQYSLSTQGRSGSASSGSGDAASPTTVQAMDWDFRIGPIHIHIRFIFGPPAEATEQRLYAAGFQASGKLECTDRDMPEGYEQASSKTLTVGRVFGVPWPDSTQMRDAAPGAVLRTKHPVEQLFVVVVSGETFFSALPIFVPDQQEGTSPMAPETLQERSMVYTGLEIPQPLPNEAPIRSSDGGVATLRPTIAVVPMRGSHMEPTLRLDYGRIYTIKRGVPVRRVGDVHGNSQQVIDSTFPFVWRNKTGSSSCQELLAPEPRAAGSAASSIANRGQASASSAQVSRNQQRSNRARDDEFRDSDDAGSDDDELSAQLKNLNIAAGRLGVDLSRLPESTRQRIARSPVQEQRPLLMRVLQLQDPARYQQIQGALHQQQQRRFHREPDVENSDEEEDEEEDDDDDDDDEENDDD